MTTHPQSPSTTQNRNASHIDSDGDPPLINVTHHMHTEEETAYDDDFDIDNLPFICHSQPSATMCQMPETISKNVYEQSSSESVEVPNAQREKYHLPTDMTSSSKHNNDSSSIPNDQNWRDNYMTISSNCPLKQYWMTHTFTKLIKKMKNIKTNPSLPNLQVQHQRNQPMAHILLLHII